MSKSHAEELSKIYECLLLDAADAYPALRGSFERDLRTLVTLINTRGIHTCCVDLPNVCKHLDRCLDEGEYSSLGLPTTRRLSRKVAVPALFSGLYLLIFDESGQLKEDCDVQAILFLRQLLLVGKRTKIDCSRDKVLDEILSFITTDRTLPVPSRQWQSPADFDLSRQKYATFTGSDYYWEKIEVIAEKRTENPEEGEVSSGVYSSARMERHRLQGLLAYVDKVSRYVCQALGHYDFREWDFKHGPGAIAQVTKPSNKYHWYNWSDHLESAFPIADCGFHNYCSWAGSVHLVDSPEYEEPHETGRRNNISSIDPSSRMVDVPKTYTKPRLIAAEPSEHMWCQQNIWNYMETRSRASWINGFIQYRDQSLNQNFAIFGSKGGYLATVDLSAASDHVTCHVVECMFRDQPELLQALRASRTRGVSLSAYTDLLDRASDRADIDTLNLLLKSVDKDWVMRLRKFSTMGNACTFPVESLIFLTVAIAATLYHEGQPVTLESINSLIGLVTVYGDDIIVPRNCLEELFTVLEILDFKVNHEKTYGGNNFRESCGVDAFRGENVSPVYWKQPWGSGPESWDSSLAVRNRFYQRWFLHTASYLTSTRPSDQHYEGLAAVTPDSGVTGLVTWNRASAAHTNLINLRMRQNAAIQRYEVLVRCLKSKQTRTASSDDTATLQYFTEKPDRLEKWQAGVSQRPTSKLRCSWVPIDLLPFPSRVYHDSSRMVAGTHEWHYAPTDLWTVNHLAAFGWAHLPHPNG